ncbi:unnamed protein product [Ectocarpus sp. CCAP 1310/34]|nr:unnamed protein product [Ectocarpus sp. CCAP 1310/34]
MTPSSSRQQQHQRRPRPVPRGVTILSAFTSALLASAPRSDAFLALPPAALAATARGGGGGHDRQHGGGGGGVTTSAAAFACSTRLSSRRCAAAPALSSRRGSRNGRGSTLVMAGGEGDDGGEGGALTEGEGVVEGVISRSPVSPPAAAAASGEEGCEGGEQDQGAAVAKSISGDDSGEKAKKKRKKKSGGKSSKAGAPRLRGDALRDELMRREKREEERVLAMNTLFYRSRAYNEIEDLKRVWDKSDLSECIRSAGSPLKGYDKIIEEYKTEFVLAQKQEKPGLRPFKVKNVKVQTCGTLAWVTCIEDMRSPYKSYPKTVQLVTNIFRKTSNGWRLTRHHSSDRDIIAGKGGRSAKQALKGVRELPGGGGILQSLVDNTGGVTEVSAKLFSVVNGEMKPIDIDLDGSDDDDDDEDEEEEDITDDIGREIASQIFLNYADLFDGRDGGDGASLGEISFSASGPMGGDSIDETIPPAMRKRIEEAMESTMKKKRSDASRQRYENIYNVSEGLKEVVAEGGGGGGGGGGSETAKEWHEWQDAATSDSDDGGKGWSSFGGGEGKAGGDGDGEAALKGSRDLTRKTVDAVRVLAEMGRIGEEEKSLLLADVIRNASSDVASKVEIAYSVLLDGEVTPEGMEYTDKAEEFAHQCKAIAGQLLEQSNSNRPGRWRFWAKPQWWKFWASKDSE